MKTLLLVLFTSFGAFPAATSLAQAPLALEDVCQAIGAGDLDKLASIMDSEIELNLLGNEDLYTKTDALAKLKGFFATATPSSFGKVHQGASQSDDAEYCIGTLTTAKGPYTVYVYVAKNGGTVLLQELRIEK